MRLCGRALLQEIADGVDQVGFAKADAAINKQRVIGFARALRDLDGGGACQIVGFAGDERRRT